MVETAASVFLDDPSAADDVAQEAFLRLHGDRFVSFTEDVAMALWTCRDPTSVPAAESLVLMKLCRVCPFGEGP